ncbi:thiamine pyrophosphate-binding protein [Azomonas macrocytogenes]|uniref:Benzoylformate decarboxylase n=1 Tax=Azomonas macrocytogenes TaxID=69962 RepID=A0A839SXB7_AZOMA|nr:thiamine pyrophosphate-binding protein [Azomonas macrocytogenes]MBB3102001.1 benzoylformate decarboxylase [Azomonas macrocytogenes]
MSFTRLSDLEKSPRRRGADILLELLHQQGVEYIFGNPGTTELPLMDALADHPDIQYILALQEACVVAMADGYAQASGRPGFLNLHTAGGLGHGMGNLLNAAISQTPLVVTAGQQDMRHSLTDPLLFGDLVRIAAPAVKWAQEVTSANQLPVLVRRAFQDASAAPSGPVFLSLPMNVMEELSDVDTSKVSHIEYRSCAGSLDLLAGQLAAVAPGRLMLIAGDEVHGSGAAEEVVQLAELLGAPVYGSSWPAHIPFPTAHALWAGNLSPKAAEIARELEHYDAVFALGGKSLITILYSEGPVVPPQCEIYQLSTDVRDLGRTFPTRLSLVGDIRTSLRGLLPQLAPLVAGTASQRSELIRQAATTRRAARQNLEQDVRAEWTASVISPLVAAHEAAHAIGPQVAIVDEAIATAAHLRHFLDSPSARQYAFLRGGGLGWGMPAAVGYSLGLGREPVVCLVGDGAALYSPQALWTAAHEKLPVTFVVMNNHEYNVLKNFMKAQTDYASVRKGKFIAMDLIEPLIDYQAMAASMGVPAVRVSRATDIAPAIRAGIEGGTANLVEIMIGT